jgi:hypothetical protein
MFELGKHTADQYVLTIHLDDHKVPMIIGRRDLLVLWNRIAEVIHENKK